MRRNIIIGMYEGIIYEIDSTVPRLEFKRPRKNWIAVQVKLSHCGRWFVGNERVAKEFAYSWLPAIDWRPRKYGGSEEKAVGF